MRVSRWILLTAALITQVLASAHSDNIDAIRRGIPACIAKAAPTDRIACFTTLCEPDYECGKSLLIATPREKGPAEGLRVLDDLMTSTAFNLGTDGHELAHIVGRETGWHFGFTGDALLKCPTEYFYGCVHGFFEAALSASPKPPMYVARSICDGMTTDNPGLDRFTCYHGVGHGLMMFAQNDIVRSIAYCNDIQEENANNTKGCWQGAFMENINAEARGEARKDIFLPDDPLSPCNRVDAQYQWECYINHSAYIMRFTDNDIVAAAQKCLQAAGTGRAACIAGIAQMTTNPGWQPLIIEQRPSLKDEKGFIPTAVKICGGFPEETLHDCIIYAVGNALNYGKENQAMEFCSIVAKEFQRDCY